MIVMRPVVDVREVTDWSRFCDMCERIVPEGTEHDWRSHLADEQSAKELAAWKASFKECS
jgi:hypothetical protein